MCVITGDKRCGCPPDRSFLCFWDGLSLLLFADLPVFQTTRHPRLKQKSTSRQTGHLYSGRCLYINSYPCSLGSYLGSYLFFSLSWWAQTNSAIFKNFLIVLFTVDFLLKLVNQSSLFVYWIYLIKISWF